MPLRIQGEGLTQLAANTAFPVEVRNRKIDYWNRVNSGQVFLEKWVPVHTDLFIAGLEISVCRSCVNAAIWLGGEIVYPRA